MQLPHGAVVALVDGRKFELYRNRGDEADPALEALEAPVLDVHDKSGGAKRDSSLQNPTGHQIEEDAHALAAAEWLNGQVLSHKIGAVAIIAAPRTLGMMRGRYHKALEAALISELDKALAGRPAPEILAALRQP